AVVPGGAEPAVDVAGGEDEAPALGQVDDAVHQIRRGGHDQEWYRRAWVCSADGAPGGARGPGGREIRPRAEPGRVVRTARPASRRRACARREPRPPG